MAGYISNALPVLMGLCGGYILTHIFPSIRSNDVCFCIPPILKTRWMGQVGLLVSFSADFLWPPQFVKRWAGRRWWSLRPCMCLPSPSGKKIRAPPKVEVFRFKGGCSCNWFIYRVFIQAVPGQFKSRSQHIFLLLPKKIAVFTKAFLSPKHSAQNLEIPTAPERPTAPRNTGFGNLFWCQIYHKDRGARMGWIDSTKIQLYVSAKNIHEYIIRLMTEGIPLNINSGLFPVRPCQHPSGASSGTLKPVLFCRRLLLLVISSL